VKDFLRWGAVAASIVALMAACSSKPPSISRVYARVIYQHDVTTGASSEGLSVFLVATDPDGIENLRSFYVINDEAELFWQVDSTSWVSSKAEGETWIGSNNLAMPGSQGVPAGSYRVLLENAGGDTAEETFTVSPREEPASKAAYPSAVVKDGSIAIAGPYASVDIWTYGKDGKFVATFPANRASPPLSVRTMTAASPPLALGFSFRVFADNGKAGYAALAGPYTVGAIPPAPGAPPPLPPLPPPGPPGQPPGPTPAQ
jgi:hypothetical protein